MEQVQTGALVFSQHIGKLYKNNKPKRRTAKINKITEIGNLKYISNKSQNLIIIHQ